MKYTFLLLNFIFFCTAHTQFDPAALSRCLAACNDCYLASSEHNGRVDINNERLSISLSPQIIEQFLRFMEGHCSNKCYARYNRLTSSAPEETPERDLPDEPA